MNEDTKQTRMASSFVPKSLFSVENVCEDEHGAVFKLMLRTDVPQ